MKKTIIGYIPTAIFFGGPLSAELFTGLLCSFWLDDRSCHGEFNSAALFTIGISILSVTIGTILNLAFLAYAGFTGRLMKLYDYGGTAEGIVSRGGAVTATITFLVQFGIIISILLSR
ncbi:hypothetical protein VU08_07345 [Desulfobulbus sp. F5]|nr:hypothetical protein [Desulfobulbus sp. F5]